MKKWILFVGVFVLLIGNVRSTDLRDRDEKVEKLLARMTLEEKIGQLNQRSGKGLPELVRAGAVGSVLNEAEPEVIDRLQHDAVERSRLGIPLIFARDVIHGFKTLFPIPLGLAATWNPELVQDGARIAAEEASSIGIRWTFSPMIDVSRDARWGRIAESSGEDPYLTSVMGVAMVKGYQGDDLSRPDALAACAKHFAGYGACESGKDYNTTWIPEVQLRDTYLPPFEAVAKAGAATFMCSFNDICGIPSSGNEYLLRHILRDEWGFRGVVCSDWGSIREMIPHGFCTDLKDAARKAAVAGVDIDMESQAYSQHLKQLVESGELDVRVIDDMVRNVLRLKFDLGLFEHPYADRNIRGFYEKDALEKARLTAEESAVLLKNTGILPLSADIKKIAVVGPMANAPHEQVGTWSFDVEDERCVTPLAALTGRYGQDAVKFASGLSYSRDKRTEGIAEAVQAAREADVVLMFAGEEAILSGEAHCRADISLPGAQSQMIEELKATGKPLVLIVMTGRPMTIAREIEMADAVLYAFHGGTMAGPALANLLTGEAVPSGKLPVCLPVMVGQMPLYYAHKNTGRPADRHMVLMDDIPVATWQTSTGCSCFHMDAGDKPLYPFGFGLSYTQFRYGEVRLSSDVMKTDGTVTVCCRVENTGTRDGDEVVQLYVRDMVGSLTRPVKELKGFKKVRLKAGESRDVHFTLHAEDLAFHLLDNRKVVEPGEFRVWVAADSDSGNPVKLTVQD